MDEKRLKKKQKQAVVPYVTDSYLYWSRWRSVLDNTFHNDIEGSSEKNVVGGLSNNMDLQIEGERAYLAWYVPYKAQRLVDAPVRRLHTEGDRRIER